MKKGFIVIITACLICLAGAGFLSVRQHQAVSKSFYADGYVLSPLEAADTGAAAGYSFSTGTSYRVKFPAKVVFAAAGSEKAVVDDTSFAHYSSRALSAFTEGVFVNLDSSSELQTSYYDIGKDSVVAYLSDGYLLYSQGVAMYFHNFIWKTGDTRFMVVSDNLTLDLGSSKVEAQGYLEVQYSDGGVVFIYNADGMYQAAASSTSITTANGVTIHLGDQSVTKGQESLFALNEVLIGDEENADTDYINYIDNAINELMPDFQAVNGASGSQGEDGYEGAEGDYGPDGQFGATGATGIAGADGADGLIGNIGNNGRDDPNYDSAATVDQDPDYQLMPTAKINIVPDMYSVWAKLNLYGNSEKYAVITNDNLKVEIIEKNTGRTLILEEMGFPVNTAFQESGDSVYSSPKVLDPDTEYILRVYGDVNRKMDDSTIRTYKDYLFISRNFVTNGMGLTMTRDFVGSDSISVELSALDTCSLTSFNVSLYDAEGNLIPVTADIGSQTAYSFISSDITDMKTSPARLTWKDLKSNTTYKVKIENAIMSGGVVDYVFNREYMTLKQAPVFREAGIHAQANQLTRSLNFSLNVDRIIDADNGIQDYTFYVHAYNTETGSDTIVTQRTVTNPSSVNFYEGMDGLLFTSEKILYYATCDANFYDNEKMVNYATGGSSNRVSVTNSVMPTVSFQNVTELTWESVKGILQITDPDKRIKDGSIYVTYNSSMDANETNLDPVLAFVRTENSSGAVYTSPLKRSGLIKGATYNYTVWATVSWPSVNESGNSVNKDINMKLGTFSVTMYPTAAVQMVTTDNNSSANETGGFGLTLTAATADASVMDRYSGLVPTMISTMKVKVMRSAEDGTLEEITESNTLSYDFGEGTANPANRTSSFATRLVDERYYEDSYVPGSSPRVDGIALTAASFGSGLVNVMSANPTDSYVLHMYDCRDYAGNEITLLNDTVSISVNVPYPEITQDENAIRIKYDVTDGEYKGLTATPLVDNSSNFLKSFYFYVYDEITGELVFTDAYYLPDCYNMLNEAQKSRVQAVTGDRTYLYANGAVPSMTLNVGTPYKWIEDPLDLETNQDIRTFTPARGHMYRVEYSCQAVNKSSFTKDELLLWPTDSEFNSWWPGHNRPYSPVVTLPKASPKVVGYFDELTPATSTEEANAVFQLQMEDTENVTTFNVEATSSPLKVTFQLSGDGISTPLVREMNSWSGISWNKVGFSYRPQDPAGSHNKMTLSVLQQIYVYTAAQQQAYQTNTAGYYKEHYATGVSMHKADTSQLGRITKQVQDYHHPSYKEKWTDYVVALSAAVNDHAIAVKLQVKNPDGSSLTGTVEEKQAVLEQLLAETAGLRVTVTLPQSGSEPWERAYSYSSPLVIPSIDAEHHCYDLEISMSDVLAAIRSIDSSLTAEKEEAILKRNYKIEVEAVYDTGLSGTDLTQLKANYQALTGNTLSYIAMHYGPNDAATGTSYWGSYFGATPGTAALTGAAWKVDTTSQVAMTEFQALLRNLKPAYGTGQNYEGTWSIKKAQSILRVEHNTLGTWFNSSKVTVKALGCSSVAQTNAQGQGYVLPTVSLFEKGVNTWYGTINTGVITVTVNGIFSKNIDGWEDSNQIKAQLYEYEGAAIGGKIAAIDTNRQIIFTELERNHNYGFQLYVTMGNGSRVLGLMDVGKENAYTNGFKYGPLTTQEVISLSLKDSYGYKANSYSDRRLTFDYTTGSPANIYESTYMRLDQYDQTGTTLLRTYLLKQDAAEPQLLWVTGTIDAADAPAGTDALTYINGKLAEYQHVRVNEEGGGFYYSAQVTPTAWESSFSIQLAPNYVDENFDYSDSAGAEYGKFQTGENAPYSPNIVFDPEQYSYQVSMQIWPKETGNGVSQVPYSLVSQKKYLLQELEGPSATVTGTPRKRKFSEAEKTQGYRDFQYISFTVNPTDMRKTLVIGARKEDVIRYDGYYMVRFFERVEENGSETWRLVTDEDLVPTGLIGQKDFAVGEDTEGYYAVTEEGATKWYKRFNNLDSMLHPLAKALSNNGLDGIYNSQYHFDRISSIGLNYVKPNTTYLMCVYAMPNTKNLDDTLFGNMLVQGMTTLVQADAARLLSERLQAKMLFDRTTMYDAAEGNWKHYTLSEDPFAAYRIAMSSAVTSFPSEEIVVRNANLNIINSQLVVNLSDCYGLNNVETMTYTVIADNASLIDEDDMGNYRYFSGTGEKQDPFSDLNENDNYATVILDGLGQLPLDTSMEFRVTLKFTSEAGESVSINAVMVNSVTP